MRAGLATLAFCLLSMAAADEGPRLKVALTFDDLPLNGTLPLGARQSDFARDTIGVLRRHRIPPSYGFINAGKLERNPDGAKALRIWADGGHPLANHTYNHLDLTRSSVEDFQREILRNEPVLSLLMPSEGRLRRLDWRWFRYPYLHEGDTATASHRPRSISRTISGTAPTHDAGCGRTKPPFAGSGRVI
jgi:peptidoglycan-N-acetylglucosamine deacetylase